MTRPSHDRVRNRAASGPASYGFVLTGDKLAEYRVRSEYARLRWDGEPITYERDGRRWRGPSGLAPRIDEQALALTVLGGDERFGELVETLSQLMVYSIFPDMLRQPQDFDPTRPMRAHGENWVSALDRLLQEPGREELIKGLHKLTGDIEDIRVTRVAGFHVAEFKQHSRAKKGKRWFSSRQQSDGTLRVAGLLTALLQRPALPLLAVEEPELTIHPGTLPMIHDYLVEASELSQVVFSTHSPILLDVLDTERTSLQAVRRVEGQTHIQRISEEQLRPVRAELLSLDDAFVSGDLQLALFDASGE